VIGDLQALMVLIKGLPLAYNRDMQEDKPPLFDAADHFAGSLEVLRLCIETTRLKPEAMERAAQDSWTCATALAEFLARNGVPFHRAHQIVGGLVLQSVRDGKKPQDWTLPELKQIAPEFNEAAAELLFARRALENHTPRGGTAPASVALALADAEQRLAGMQRGR
jgi:argininosuccinate lyase